VNITIFLDILLGVSAVLALVGLLATAVKLVRDDHKRVNSHVTTKAYPPLAEQTLYHVVSIGIQAQDAEEQAQNALEEGSPQDQRAALGNLSVMMSNLQEHTIAAVEELKSLLPDDVNRLMNAAQ